MGSKLTRALVQFLIRLGHVASFFSDVPPFLVWIGTVLPSILEIVTSEPVGAAALLCSLAVGVAVAWLIVKMKPPVL